jgi:pyruvate-ferredoxin/flavodoxin oxidoreductase
VEVRPAGVSGDVVTRVVGAMPRSLDMAMAAQGLANPGRFWEQVASPSLIGEDGIADPFAAVSVLPAATAAMRDMTGIRFEVPDFIPSKCTGCAQCWTQCPDSAIPGLVNSVEDVIDSAIRYAARDNNVDKLRAISKHLAKESKKVMESAPFTTFGEVFQTAFMNVLPKVAPEPAKQLQLTGEFAHAYAIVRSFPLAKTLPFYEKNQGLLSITINPEACKGCNICVEVCPENALVTIKQDDQVVEQLRKNWGFWQELPDTDDKFINIRSLEEGIGVLPAMLLKKKTYRSMIGGDGACMGCGEKTSVHLVTSTIEALMQPRVAKFVAELNQLIQQLEEKNSIELSPTLNALTDLRWRYTQGPSGRGRASLGMANSTGCSSVWGSTYPYNPYPFPWVNHLFQDSPSIAIGLFEGQMRKMADAFGTVRKARAMIAGEPIPDLVAFDWRQFTDEEFGMCPPIIAMGGDGAMLDIGFQNLSRLMASGKPLRVVVLDTQVYSNTGGQACTSGFTGQVADMSAYGKAQHGKEETRKELALIALAHRGTFVLQSSQASASHLISGLLKGLQTRRPAVFNIYTPCPVEHGLPDEWAPHSARLALESRAFPFMVYDPDAGKSVADCLSLEGNPALDDVWPTYSLEYLDDDGATQKLELPLTIADWAATEARFKKHFKHVKDAEVNGEDADMLVPFAEFIAFNAEERTRRTPFIYTVDAEKKLRKLTVSLEMVQLATDRLLFWSQLKELAGLQISEDIRDSIASALQADYEVKMSALRAEYEAKIGELKSRYPKLIARRLAEGLLGAGNRNRTVAELLESAETYPGLEPIAFESLGDLGNGETDVGERGRVRVRANGDSAVTDSAEVSSARAHATALANGSSESATAVVESDDDFGIEAYIETARCTSCNECTNLNSRLFAYDANKQAYIKDLKAGTFAQLVTAAERCPAALIHPGTPVNPNEKDLAKWLKRAEAFA